ncbi:MAG: ABC transporter ATP-binding protein [Fimbriimonadaceae bacterium]|nr:ABC transporter ATP-binding protein [Fimbriimonadaceae bacterium]
MRDPRPLFTLTEEEALAEHPALTKKGAWEALKFCLPWLKPYVAKLTLITLADIGLLALSFVPPWFTTFMLDSALPQNDWALVWRIVLLMLATGITMLVMQTARDYVYFYVELKIQLDIRNRMYRQIQRLSMNTIDGRPVGQMVDRVLIDSDRVGHTIYRIIPTFLMVVQFALLFAYVSYVDPLITGIVVLFLIPWTMLFHWVTTIGREIDRRRLYCCEMRDATIQQAASSFSITKSFGRSRHEVFKHGRRATAVQRLGNQNYLILVWFEFATVRLLPYLKTTTVYLYFMRKVVLGEMTLGMTAPMIAYLGRLNFPLERIANFYNWVRQTMVSTERLMAFLQVRPDVMDRPGATRLSGLAGRVRVENVSFSRANRGRVLDDVTMVLEPGRTTALVGPSGAGKSTLVAMLLRLHDPEEGRVVVDDRDLRDVRLDSYLRRVAVVQQETFVFGGTLANNVKLGKPRASDDEVRAVLGRVGLGDWLASLPDGLDQDLQSGHGLSVGQKQRIGIARALIGDPGLVILDEPTSALDGPTERDIMATLKDVFGAKTVLLVTHRLHTVIDADTIVVIDQGRVVESGSHESLREAGGVYARLIGEYGKHPSAVGVGGAAR